MSYFELFFFRCLYCRNPDHFMFTVTLCGVRRVNNWNKFSKVHADDGVGLKCHGHCHKNDLRFKILVWVKLVLCMMLKVREPSTS